MFESNFSYREIIPDQTISDVPREISLNTGGTQSILQDIKVAERAGGFCYQNASRHITRNRFISWRINHDVLELTEQSLDVNLSGNKIKYKFIDTPILDGISINETQENVVVLVPTVCSVHRLTFQHPNRLHRQEELRDSHPDLVLPSIFADANASQARDVSTFFVFSSPSSANTQLPHAAASTLTPGDATAIFLLAYPIGELLLVKQARNGQVLTAELSCDRLLVPRFLSGLADKFRAKTNDSNVIVSMLLHTVAHDVYAFTLCRDGHLKVWSCVKGHCLAIHDLLAETTDHAAHLVQSAQHHSMRKGIGERDDDDDLVLVVFMSFVSESQFHIFKPVFGGGAHFSIMRINSLYAPGTDLVDFHLSGTRMWSLWRNDDGDANLFTARVGGGGAHAHWVPVLLEPVPDVNTIEEGVVELDPRQAYLQQIFYPGRFPLHIISKALSIYRRAPLLVEAHLSLASLKHRVSMAVESEIQNELKEMEVIDEDYLECATLAWSKFYSCCVQYYTAGLRPLGLLLLPAVSGVVLLKKSLYAFVRPLDALEHLMLCADYAHAPDLARHPLLADEPTVVEHVLTLMHAVVYLEQQLSDVFKQTFEQRLARLHTPDAIIADLMLAILTETDEQFAWTIAKKLKECRDIYQAMHKLLELIRLDECVAVTENRSDDDGMQDSLRHMFTSTLGVSVAAQCIRQQAAVRFALCRNLLVVQHILIERGEHEWNTLEAVRSVCLPEIVVLIQASYATLYVTQLPALPFVAFESTAQALAPLNLTPVFHVNTAQHPYTLTLLELFVRSTGGVHAHRHLAHAQEGGGAVAAHWHRALLVYVTHVLRVIWPVNGHAVFAEWLLSAGQTVWLQQYVRLLNNWCEWNNCTRSFLLAVALLNGGEYGKALDLFQKAAMGVFNERFLAERMLGCVRANATRTHVYVQYYLKVIQLFELHGARDYAIKMAVTAITIADGEDAHVATLYSLKFVHHLALGHYEAAYNALNANPDQDRKKDNLRDLIKVLLENGELKTLLAFPYTGLKSTFVNILFARARARDPLVNVYYDVLHAYYIKLGAAYMRMGAVVMHERAYRLQGGTTVADLEQQVKCLLAAINALHLCKAEYAWIVRPASEMGEWTETITPLRDDDDDDGEEEPMSFVVRREIDVVEIDDLRKEYYFASAKLSLVRFNANFSINSVNSPAELAALMASVGLFKQALVLCVRFKIDAGEVFDRLTGQCVTLNYTEDATAWEWLIENDLHDFKVISNMPSSAAWDLLQSLIAQYEEERMTVFHKIVCIKCIKMCAFIPQWLLASYKKRNCAELIRVLYMSGRLHDAVDVSVEYLRAALGEGREFFGVAHEMAPASPQLHMPINLLENLLYELDLQNGQDDEQPFKQEYTMLREAYVQYLDTSKRISDVECGKQVV